jgi:hypothetical protein
MINAPASGTTTGSNSGSSAGTQGGAKLNVTSSSGTTSIPSSAERDVAAINAKVSQEQAKYIDQISQIINSVCGLSANCKELNNLETQLYQTGASYLKPVFSTNATGTMHVGDVWNITVTGLTPGETLYATGGKIINNVVPADKTPYTADGLGIFFQTGTHAADVIGNWQIVWTRANGTVLGTMTFSVTDKTSSTPPSDCSLTATCGSGGGTPSPTGLTFANAVIGGLGTSTFRYIAVQTMRDTGWVKWNEVEAYDASGAKVTPVKVYASGSYIDSNGGSFQNLIDGNPNTFWNSGGYDASTGLGKGNPWFIVDYGAVKTFSKLRFANSDDGGGPQRLYVSSDAKNYSELWSFTTGGHGFEWKEYAFTSYTGNPSTTASINGASSATINTGDSLRYDWNSTNADIVEAEFTGGEDYPFVAANLSVGLGIDPCTQLNSAVRTILPLGSFRFSPFPANGPLVGDIDGPGSFVVNPALPGACPVNRTYHFEVRAKQSLTGKTSTSSATLKILGTAKLADLWQVISSPTQLSGLIDLNNFPAGSLGDVVNNISIGQGSSKNIQVWVSSQINIGPEISVAVDSSSPGITATYTTVNSTPFSGYGRQIGSLAITVSPGASLPGQVKLRSTYAGDTKYTTIIVN